MATRTPDRLNTLRNLKKTEKISGLVSAASVLLTTAYESHSSLESHTMSSDGLTGLLYLLTLTAASTYFGSSILRQRAEKIPVNPVTWIGAAIVGAVDVYMGTGAFGIGR